VRAELRLAPRAFGAKNPQAIVQRTSSADGSSRHARQAVGSVDV
jgi:hypothetical protein